jgi:sialate O-acetylesterase
MAALIKGWRRVWRQGGFPFYYVQLAPYAYSARKQVPPVPADALPLTWEAQTRALRLPHTGMAVIHDTVDNYGDIHPVRKREVGERLALIALANDYGVKVVSSGPTFKSVRFNKGEAVVRFDHAEGLTTRDGRAPDWFEIAGADGKYFPADAVIRGTEVILKSSSVAQPGRVRLGWGERAKPNLINQAGLPARPFSTEY